MLHLAATWRCCCGSSCRSTMRTRRSCTSRGRATPTSGSAPRPHLHRDWAHRCHICAGTGRTAATSAPGLGSPLLVMAVVAYRTSAPECPEMKWRNERLTEAAASTRRWAGGYLSGQAVLGYSASGSAGGVLTERRMPLRHATTAGAAAPRPGAVLAPSHESSAARVVTAHSGAIRGATTSPRRQPAGTSS